MREFHDVANIFPMMDDEQFNSLVEDIKTNGLLMPIWLHPDDGSIIDGRNRYKACLEAEATPHYKTWDGRGSLVAFVVSLNFNRRHLTSSQRATLAVDVLPMFEKEAHENKKGGRGGILLVEIVPQANAKSRDKVAQIFNTNARYVQDAKKLKENAPALFQAVASGELTITKAKRQMVADSKKDAPPLPDDRYNLVYADPPWSYGNTMPDYFTEQEDHYPVMSLTDICALPIKDILADNAVMFLWVTSPILEESFEVIKAWGFKYKTSFVWDKVKHNMGHYNSVRHELLLVCVKGSFKPQQVKLFDSVQSIERTTHSKKPKEFRDIIEYLYPNTKKIELFARKKNEGWATWGNEA